MGMKASNAIATFFKYFVLILVGLIMIYPLLWMISATFKDNSEIFAGIGLWIKNPTLEGYKNALNNFGGSINILQAMLNTYSYVLPKVICTVVSSCIAAYGFGRFGFPGREILPVDCLELVWGLGTLHCISQQQPAAGKRSPS